MGWGRFTERGGDAVEARIAGMIEEAKAALERALPVKDLRAVVLIGGYGRGEGGVDDQSGEEQPNNNFDFLIVARPGADPGALSRRAHDAMAPLSAKWGLGIDVSAIGQTALERSPCLVMWYDMRFGHKPVLGDPSYVRGLEAFRLERVESWDVRNLLVNRGTLLVINHVLLEQAPSLDVDQRRAVVRHAVKAVIGYGDALLFFLGDYHYSYAEKQRRMRAREDVPPAFRALYEEAMERRFRPRYRDFDGRDLAAWNRELTAALEPVHLRCEALRLGVRDLDWEVYADAAFGRELVEGLPRPRMVARKAVGLLRSARAGALANGASGLRPRARVGLWTARPRERLPLIFPVVAYPIHAPSLEALARRELGCPHGDRTALARAYLRAWGEHGDINFPRGLAKLGIDLGAAA